jgi:membrane associated rhomboid family serine protease
MVIGGALPYREAAAVLAFVLAAALAVRLNDEPVGERLRGRFLLGLPWGTLVVVGGVLGVYLFVQGGLAHWYRPVVVPFRAWSFFSPLGMVASSFAHTGPGHLVGNLVATLAYGSLAEYAYGHYPTERGSSSFGSAPENPYVRAFVVVPAASVAVGLVLAPLSLGPVIGFSGVVFAYAGFALVHYPLATVVASVVTRVPDLLYDAVSSPEPVVESRPVFVTPWFADIALQTHALGLVAGALLGIYAARRRGTAASPASPGRLWFGALTFAVASSLWAVYWFRGGGSFVLYRWAGVALVSALALLVTAAATASERPLLPRLAASADRETLVGGVKAISPRQVAAVVVLLSVAGLGGPAVPVNLVTAAGGELPSDAVTVRDYEVTYAEDVPNGMVGVLDVDAFGESTRVNTSGVIVRSDRRNIWFTAVQSGRLDLNGRAGVVVGGVGWRERVAVDREGWNVVGNGTVYRVNLTHRGETTTAFVSEPRTAEPVVADRNVSVAATGDRFVLAVEYDGYTSRAPIPAVNESVVVSGLTFERGERALYAVATNERGDVTRVRVAGRETFRGRQ